MGNEKECSFEVSWNRLAKLHVIILSFLFASVLLAASTFNQQSDIINRLNWSTSVQFVTI